MSFINQKIINYYKSSSIPIKCLNYLNKNYPKNNNKIDHIAFRSIYNKNFQKLNDSFIYYNYQKMSDKYILDSNKYAFWYKNNSNNISTPRIFSSICNIDQTSKNIIDDKYLSFIEKYNKLLKIDDYIAWTFAFNDEINHIAIDMSDYGNNYYNVINTMIKDLELNMNNVDDIFQISQDGLLIQCSTKSELFNDYNKNFIEFVKREKDGFETKNATVILKSTFI
jgi:hypothetical protein